MTYSIDSLRKIADDLKIEFDRIDKEREIAFVTARELRRLATQAIREIHKGSLNKAEEMIKSCIPIAEKLSPISERYNFIEEALQEYSESALTAAFIKKEVPPLPEEIKTSKRGYLLGLADAVGELRRHILDLMKQEKFPDAEFYLDLMDEIFYLLLKFDHTDAVLPMRRKQDALRGILDRTRGELTSILCQKRLEDKIGNFVKT